MFALTVLKNRVPAFTEMSQTLLSIDRKPLIHNWINLEPRGIDGTQKGLVGKTNSTWLFTSSENDASPRDLGNSIVDKYLEESEVFVCTQ